jgi:sodium/potassium-transporting ATPase subunit alpha
MSLPQTAPILVETQDFDNDHRLDIKSISQKYGTCINMRNTMMSDGLTDDQISKNREKYGSNLLPEQLKPSPFRVLLMHFQNLFSVILVVCGCMSLILYAVFPKELTHAYVGVTLILVSVFNAFQEFYQTSKSKQLLKGLMKLVPDYAYVRRNGHIQQISAAELVVGDLLILRLGDKIAADSRVIYSLDLKVDNSILTGESEAVGRNAETQQCGSLFEAKNIVFNGATVSSGDGLAIVIRTGKNSEIGKLTLLNETSEAAESQLSQEMAVAVRTLVTFGLITGSLLMIISFAQGFGIAVSFTLAIGSFLSFLPQGLPSTITTLLTVAAKRMAKKNVLVKNLQGVETLGAITLLATDKTGTLTMNRMDAVEIWQSSRDLMAIEQASNENLAQSELIQACVQCSSVKAFEDGRLIGDATEQGIYRLLQKLNCPNMQGQERVFEIPFSSSTKWRLVVSKFDNAHDMVFMKGAPEKVFAFCKYYLNNDKKNCEIDDNFEKKFEEIYNNLGGRGLRVIACAGRQIRPDDNFKEKANFKIDDLTFYGLIGLQDPPKPGVSDSINRIKKAGIRVVMITGDHPLTAESISRQIGLVTATPENTLTLLESGNINRKSYFSAAIIHGEMIEKFTDLDWDRLILAEEIVFARTQPKHKLDIVKKFQEYGHVVAVCGDGANDSPALKTADLGISMNKTASDVSKEAANMILLDDNFNTIVTGISEGRLIFENLKKSIRYTLTHITAEISSLASVAMLGLAFPFPALLILVFDVFAEMGPAMSFATEPAPVDFLKLKPRLKPRLKRNLNPEITSQNIKLKNVISDLYHPKTEGELLIDGELLFWAFLQGGIFIAIGAFASYLLTMIWNNVPISSLWRSVNKYFESSIGVEVEPLTLTTGEVVTIFIILIFGFNRFF